MLALACQVIGAVIITSHNNGLTIFPGMVANMRCSLPAKLRGVAIFFYKLWLASGSDTFHAFVYNDGDLNSYEEGLEWLDWICELGVASLTFAKTLEVRKLLPVNPAVAAT